MQQYFHQYVIWSKGQKGKNKQMRPYQNKKLLHGEKKHQLNEKGTNCMRKYICQLDLGQGFDLQNIQRTHMTPFQEDKQPN